jgi:hypothetical protein
VPTFNQRLSRSVLLGPAFMTRAAARSARTPEERWMLRQPRSVRESFVREVLDRGDDPILQEKWMLTQSDEVRHSYVREVLEAR